MTSVAHAGSVPGSPEVCPHAWTSGGVSLADPPLTCARPGLRVVHGPSLPVLLSLCVCVDLSSRDAGGGVHGVRGADEVPQRPGATPGEQLPPPAPEFSGVRQQGKVGSASRKPRTSKRSNLADYWPSTLRPVLLRSLTHNSRASSAQANSSCANERRSSQVKDAGRRLSDRASVPTCAAHHGVGRSVDAAGFASDSVSSLIPTHPSSPVPALPCMRPLVTVMLIRLPTAGVARAPRVQEPSLWERPGLMPPPDFDVFMGRLERQGCGLAEHAR